MTNDTHQHLPECDDCGARATRFDARFCDFCGAELPRPKDAAPSGPGGVSQNATGRFEALERHPETKRLLAYTPEDAGKASPATMIFGVVFLVLWITIGSVVIKGFSMAPGPMVLFPIAILGFGVVVMVGKAIQYSNFRNAPIQRQPALIVDERIEVSGGGKNSSVRTQNFTTLEHPGGKRTEVKSIPAAAGQAHPGDIGIAYLRANTLVHFGRVPV